MVRLSKISKKPILLALAAIVVVGVVIWLIARGPKNNAVIPSTSSNSSTESVSSSKSANSQSAANSSGSSNGSPSSDKSAQSEGTSPASLLTPSGNFVSNHHPGANGSPTQEQSVCNTTPGATCRIQFTKGDLVRTLEAKVADLNGAVIWNWDAGGSDTGLSSGIWEIKAIAELNGQTKTAVDGTGLQIL